MKKINILFGALFFIALSVSAQDTETTVIADTIAKQESIVLVKKTNIATTDIPYPILKSLKDSYAKHYVMKAYKKSDHKNIYFIELQKNRKWLTVAINNEGHIVRKIDKNDTENQSVATIN